MTNPEQDVIRNRQENARLLKKAVAHLQKINKFLLEKNPQSESLITDGVQWIIDTPYSELAELQRLQSEQKSEAYHEAAGAAEAAIEAHEASS